MQSKRWRTLFAALFVTCASVSAQESPQPEPRRPNAAAEKLHPRPAVSYVNFFPPTTIGEEEIEWWSRIVRLHPAQTVALTRFYEAYSVKVGEILATDVQGLWEEAAAIEVAGDPWGDPAVGIRFTNFMMRRDAVARKVQAQNAVLISWLESILAEEQKPALTRVRRLHDRIDCTTAHFDYPSANIDLTTMLLRLGIWRDFEPSQPAVFEQILDAHERQATDLMRRLHAWALDCHVKTVPLFTSLSAPPSREDSEAFAAYMAHGDAVYQQLLVINRPSKDLGKMVHDLNVRTLAQIERLIPLEQATLLRTAFEQTAYPPVYPNPFSATETLKQFETLKSLSVEQSTAIRAIAEQYSRRDHTTSTEMVDEFIRSVEHYLDTRKFDRNLHELYKTRMVALQMERREAAERALEGASMLLTPEQLAEADHLLRAFEKQTRAHKSSENGRDFRP